MRIDPESCLLPSDMTVESSSRMKRQDWANERAALASFPGRIQRAELAGYVFMHGVIAAFMHSE